MYCPKCGKENKEGAKFCAFCGEPLMQPKYQGTGNPGQSQNHKTGGTNRNTRKPQPYTTSGRPQPQISSSISIGGIPLAVLITFAGALLAFISVFTPLYKLSFFGVEASYNYFGLKRFFDDLGSDTEGIGIYIFLGVLILILAVAVAFFRFINNQKISRIISIVMLVLSIISLIACNNGASGSYGLVSIGPSAILSLIGSIIVIVGCIMN